MGVCQSVELRAVVPPSQQLSQPTHQQEATQQSLDTPDDPLGHTAAGYSDELAMSLPPALQACKPDESTCQPQRKLVSKASMNRKVTTSMLLQAAELGHTSMVRRITEESDKSIHIVNEDGDSLAMYAAATANLHMLQYLLEQSPQMATTPNTAGFTPLHVAALQGSASVVAFLLETQVSPDGPDAEVTCPLELAARAGHTAICKMLLNKGARISLVQDAGLHSTLEDVTVTEEARHLRQQREAQAEADVVLRCHHEHCMTSPARHVMLPCCHQVCDSCRAVILARPEALASKEAILEFQEMEMRDMMAAADCIPAAQPVYLAHCPVCMAHQGAGVSSQSRGSVAVVMLPKSLGAATAAVPS